MSNINLKTALSKAKEAAESKVIPDAKKLVSEAKETTQNKIIPGAKDLVMKTKDYSVESYVKAKEELVKLLDKNNNGEIDAEDIIIIGINSPGIKVNREDFLRKEFTKLYPEEVINAAIVKTPALAGIKPDDVDKIADEVVAYERNIVSGISTLLGMPGGLAMIATIPSDVAQYYGCMLRVAQKMMYLYGFQQIDVNEDGTLLDTETLNVLTICLGVMYGVSGASSALKSVAQAMGRGLEKSLMKKALTKGTLYPLIKKVARELFDTKITKQIFTGFIGKAVPVVGGIIGGGITFATFKPCCEKLKDSLKDTILANPNYIETNEDEIIDISDTF